MSTPPIARDISTHSSRLVVNDLSSRYRASATRIAARFAFGGVAAPIVGVAGSLSILPLGLVTTVSIVLAALEALAFFSRSAGAPAPTETIHTTTEGTPTCVE